MIEISDADLIGETEPNVPESEFQFPSNAEPHNPFAFDEPDSDESFVFDDSDEEGFNVDGIIFFVSKKVESDKFVLKLVRCEND